MPTTWRHLAALVLLVVLAACDLVSTPSSSVPPSPTTAPCGPEEVAGGGIEGIVVDSEGNSLADVLVFIANADGFTGTAHTTEDGRFSAPDVAGEFQITTTDLDYREEVRRVTVPCGELVEVELVLTPLEN